MAQTATQSHTATSAACDCNDEQQQLQGLETTVEADILPSEAELAKAADVELFSANGQPVTFGSLCSTSSKQERHLVIFVRHFFCGLCQDFVRHFISTVTPEYVSSLSRPTKITLIGCGGPELIDTYAKQTHCPYPLYTDPTRTLYQTLGLISTLDTGPTKPEYQKGSMLGIAARSVVSALPSGTKVTKCGKISQVGGEFLFEGDQCIWCHRMQNTRDHSALSKLTEKLMMA